MAARIPKVSLYRGNHLLPNMLPPPPPPLTLPPPPPPPPPLPSSSDPDSLNEPVSCTYALQSTSISSREESYLPRNDDQIRESTFCEISPSSSNTASIGGCKRLTSETSESPSPKKLKSEGDEGISSASTPSSSSDGANTSRRVDIMQQVKDPALPKELIKLFGPLTCELCSVSVNSTVQAKMHYIGKQHEKKVNAFLTNWCKETGQPMPTLKFSHSAHKKTTNPDDLFCKICNLALTSVQHAQQHYMGRNHLRVLNGHRPLKPGYLNKETGKWQRSPFVETDPTGRFGIGSGFLPSNSDPLGLTADLLASTSSSTGDPSKSLNKNRKFFCDLCQVATTSQDQLDMHLKGAKHRKAEKNSANAKVSQGTVAVPVTPSDSILASVIRVNKVDKSKTGITDYSIYRTPSGQYYCQPCNLTVNSETQFSQHCESKKHKSAVLRRPIKSGTKGVAITK